MYKFLGIVLLLFSTLKAQTIHKLDSLFSALKQWENKRGTEADTNTYNCYYQIGVEFQKSNPDTAIF